MDERYPRRGEAVRVVCWTALIAGPLCAVFASIGPGSAAWSLLWAGTVLAAAWFYVADQRGWPFSRTTSVQATLIGVGLASTLAVARTGWLPPLVVLAFTGLFTAAVWFSDDGPGADLGGPVD